MLCPVSLKGNGGKTDTLIPWSTWKIDTRGHNRSNISTVYFTREGDTIFDLTQWSFKDTTSEVVVVLT